MQQQIVIPDWTKLGAVLADFRRRQGLTQHQLAQRAGVSRSWLARVEGGHRSLAFEPLLRLIEALGMELTLRESSAAKPALSPQSIRRE